jgi:uncharacterized protein YdaU (DUF1376 family)
VGKTDIWMPVFIGDYLADTMHLSTEQHGAYLLLLFHLWRRGSLHDDDGALAQITGLSRNAWSNARPVLAEFFQIHDGLWRLGRVERERTRVTAKQLSNSKQAKLAAARRWGKTELLLPGMIESTDAVSIADALPDDADSHSHSQPELLRTHIFLRKEFLRSVVLIPGIPVFAPSLLSTGEPRIMLLRKCPGRDGMRKH